MKKGSAGPKAVKIVKIAPAAGFKMSGTNINA